ncbi:hypothetical protein FHT69_000231 [Rhizobium sp. BK008]|nr:hypothetical protein [Rhizobium sp. BK008]
MLLDGSHRHFTNACFICFSHGHTFPVRAPLFLGARWLLFRSVCLPRRPPQDERKRNIERSNCQATARRPKVTAMQANPLILLCFFRPDVQGHKVKPAPSRCRCKHLPEDFGVSNPVPKKNATHVHGGKSGPRSTRGQGLATTSTRSRE